MNVWIDGDRSAHGLLTVSDHTFLRGDGCFEALRVYHGKPFALDEHLARLERSVSAMQLDCPDRQTVEGWVLTAAATLDDGSIRVVVTRGDPVSGLPGSVVVIAGPRPSVPSELRLGTVVAPWHSAGRTWDLAGAKTTSYAPNMAAGRAAQRNGAHDAVLISDENVVLEGPTFTIGWFTGGTLETPSLDLLILDSITRRHAVAAAGELGFEVRPGRFHLDRLLAADEVFALSTFKEVTPVVAVDETVYPVGPLTGLLAGAFRRCVERELG